MKSMVIALIVLAIVAIVTTGAVVWKGMDSMADIATSPIVLVGALVAGIALALAVRIRPGKRTESSSDGSIRRDDSGDRS
jgi:hypothetical protein